MEAKGGMKRERKERKKSFRNASRKANERAHGLSQKILTSPK